MMLEHGKVGREYAGRVTQIISGSIGFDDWEWGVDLFADDPLTFKKLIYEMRFDEASAKFAEFGPFYVGLQFAVAELGTFLEGRAAAASGVNMLTVAVVLLQRRACWSSAECMALPRDCARARGRSERAIDKAFADFWKADDAKGAEKAAENLVKAGVDFDDGLDATQGRPAVRQGEDRRAFDAIRRPAPGVLFDNAIEVPAEYTPDHPLGSCACSCTAA